MMKTLNRPLDGALFCAALGLRVFPLRPGRKTPLFEGWQDWATTEKWQIEKFAASNTDCNWGVYCGGSGVFAIDLDEKDGRSGKADWEALTSANPTRRTLSFRTTTGGTHLLFAGMGQNTAKALAPGIDTRGQGGYIVAPGSVLTDPSTGDELGRYTILDEAPIEPVPTWLLKALGEKKVPLARPEGENTIDSIPSGERDNTLARWAGHLKAVGLEEKEILAALVEMNATRCSPPLEDEDVERIARSISKRPRKVAEASVAFADEKTKASPIKTYSLASIRAREIPEPDMALEEFADIGDTLGIFGKSKAKKSWALLQLAVSLAVGQDFLGVRVPKPRRCLLVQLEVTRDHYDRRVQRVAGGMGFAAAEELLGNLRVAHGRGQSLTPQLIAELVDLERPEVLLVDPIYPLITEENTAEGVKPVLEALAKIAEKGILVIYTHHDKKGKAGDLDLVDRGSGSGVLGRAYDAAMFLDNHATDPEAQVVRFITRNYPPVEDQTIRWEGFLFKPQEAPAEVETSGSESRKERSKTFGPSAEDLQTKIETKFAGRAEVEMKEIRVFLEEELKVGSRKRAAVIDRMTQAPYGAWSLAEGAGFGRKKLVRAEAKRFEDLI
jgi:hypothetical protein